MSQTHEIIMSGFGGQGIMLMGQLLTYAGMLEGKEVTWIPSYGPETPAPSPGWTQPPGRIRR